MISALAFVLFAAACSVLAFKRHPIWGYYFYLSTIFVHPPSRWWGYMLPDLRWAFLSAVITTLAIAIHRGRLKTDRPTWLFTAPAMWLLLFCLLMWVGTAWSVDPMVNIEETAKFTKYLIALWFVYRISDTVDNARKVLFAHAAGCTLLGIYATTQGREGDRLDGVGGPGIDDANTLGMYLGTGTIVCLGLFLMIRGRLRWVLLPMAGVIVTGLVLANSRGATVGLLAGGLTLAFCCSGMHRKQFIAMTLACAMGAAVIVDDKFINRLFTIGDVTSESEEADMSARSRKVIIDAQFRMFFDYPMGIGRFGTAKLSPEYLDERWLTKAHTDGSYGERSSHNTFMSVLVEQGVPGVIIYSCLLLWLVGTIIRVRRLQRSILDRQALTIAGTACSALVVVLVAGFGTDYLMAEVQFWMYAVLVSGLQLARRPVPSDDAVGPSLAFAGQGQIKG